jgi:hypothetical protein
VVNKIKERIMGSKVGIVAAAVALALFVFAPSASVAAHKSHYKSHDTEGCLGGGCVGQNPDRTFNDPRNIGVGSFKSTRTHKGSRSTSKKTSS